MRYASVRRELLAMAIGGIAIASSGCAVYLALSVPPMESEGAFEVTSFEPLSKALREPTVLSHSLTAPAYGEPGYDEYSQQIAALPASQRVRPGFKKTYATVKVVTPDVSVCVLRGEYRGGYSAEGFAPSRYIFHIGIESHSNGDVRVLGDEAALVPTEWHTTMKERLPEEWKGRLNRPVKSGSAGVRWDAAVDAVDASEGLVDPPEAAAALSIPAGRGGVVDLTFESYPMEAGYLDFTLRVEGSGKELRYRFSLRATEHRRIRHFM